jgi:hypothetical protein
MQRVASTSRVARRPFSTAGGKRPSTWTSSSSRTVTRSSARYPASRRSSTSTSEDRSPLIRREGNLSFHHFDPVAQALSKAERGHAQDIRDLQEMVTTGLVNPEDVRAQFDLIEPELYRLPAIDPASFRAAVDELFRIVPDGLRSVRGVRLGSVESGTNFGTKFHGRVAVAEIADRASCIATT